MVPVAPIIIIVIIIITIIIIKSLACSITVSNTTCYCSLPFLLTVFIYICSLE
jgi:hypothetical protein